jgi:hypothetical protein
MDRPRQPPAPSTKIDAETPLEDAFSVLVTESGFDALAETVRGLPDDGVTLPADASGGPPSSSVASTVRPVALGSTDRTLLSNELAVRAAAGHSPSARALVNLGDSVVALAATAAAPGSFAEPERLSSTLRSRIVSSAGQMSGQTLRSVTPASSVPPGSEGSIPVRTKARTYRPANETVGLMHRSAPGEAERLAKVHTMRAAGGPGEEATDHAIAQLLSQLAPFFDFEIVLVSAVTADRTVHRVNRGLPSDGSLDQVPRELSFCTHTVSSGEPLVVEDASEEAFFRSSVLVRDLGARSYVGMPLRSGALVLGSLCAISRQPHRIRAEDIALMSRFARVAQALVTHDAAQLEALVVEPRPWPETQGADGGPSPISGMTPVLYSQAFMQDLLDAQRARGEAGYRLVRMDRATWRGAVSRLPGSLPAGVVVDPVTGAEGATLLVAPTHPDFARVTAIAVELAGVSDAPL